VDEAVHDAIVGSAAPRKLASGSAPTNPLQGAGRAEQMMLGG
jgi:hypothetical protein